jgi:Zn-dependent membrane protease YugP
MELTEQQIVYIETNLSFYGIEDDQLKEDFLDHICSYIESLNSTNFENAYSQAISNLGGYATLQQFQREKNEKLLIKSFIIRTRNVYLTCAINAVILLIGFLFFMFQWPYSGVLLLVGFSQFIIITLPYVLFDKYKKQSQKILLTNK